MDEMFAEQTAADEAEWQRQMERETSQKMRDAAEEMKRQQVERVTELTENIAKWEGELHQYHLDKGEGKETKMDETAAERKQQMVDAFKEELKTIQKEKDKAIKEFNELEEKRQKEEELKKAKTAASAKDAEFKEMQEKIKVNADKLKKRRKELKALEEEHKAENLTQEQKDEIKTKIDVV